MARSDTRYSVYPAPNAVEVVGNSAPALNLAIECWAALLKRAMADNERTFSRIWNDVMTPGPHYFLHDWAVIAESIRGTRFDPDFAKPGELLAAAVEDRHRLERIGEKWYDPVPEEDFSGLDKAVSDLTAKLKGLSYEHAWGLILTAQWLWEHGEGVDIRKDEWWRQRFRREQSECQIGREPANLRKLLDQSRKEYEQARMSLAMHEERLQRAEIIHAELEKFAQRLRASPIPSARA